MADKHPILSLFEGIRAELSKSSDVKEQIRVIASNMDDTTRQMQAALLPVYSGSSILAAQAVNGVKSHVPNLQQSYSELRNILKDRPGEYHKYHDHWRSQNNTVSFLLAFIYWLENGTLLPLEELEAQLNLNREAFGLDLEDYLAGLCTLSNELPRYVVNRVTTGDYECPRRAASFLGDLYAGFRLINFRNDFLRKRFDGMKYDLKKVEEVLYDVKIRGLIGDVHGHAPHHATEVGAVSI